MPDSRTKALGFLKKYGMDSMSVDMRATVKIFMREMDKGLAGSSSIAMIPTYIEIDKAIAAGRKVVVLDAGGTNLRTALVSFNQNMKPLVEKFKKYPMPGTKGAVSKDVFFQTLAEYIADILPQGEKIGFCFSYPTIIYPNKDGRLIKFSKEVLCPEVHGQMIGENLLASLKTLGLTENRKIVILNDTVATLLTGMISFPGRVFSGFIGYIFGTGINGCYLESNTNILKLDGIDPGHRQIINTECGAFCHPPQGIIDRELDEGTRDPGNYRLEKMVSGGYLGKVVSKTLEKAVEDGLFENNEALKTSGCISFSTKDVDDYLHNPHNPANPLVLAMKESSKADREILFYIIDDLTDRATRLAAVALSGIVLQSGKGRSPLEPVCLTIDGTTFHLSYHFKSRFEENMRAILSGGWLRYYEIVKVEDAPLLGAAIAALTN